MGDRRQIKLVYNGNDEQPAGELYIYTHWHGSELELIVANALDRGRDRWTDETYLARIIISEVIKASGIDETTGVGIAPYFMDTSYGEFTIDFRFNHVELADDRDEISVYSYEQFVQLMLKGVLNE